MEADRPRFRRAAAEGEGTAEEGSKGLFPFILAVGVSAILGGERPWRTVGILYVSVCVRRSLLSSWRLNSGR